MTDITTHSGDIDWRQQDAHMIPYRLKTSPTYALGYWLTAEAMIPNAEHQQRVDEAIWRVAAERRT